MRCLNGGLGLLMLLFAGVQFNDPDGVAWMAVYTAPALLALLAAFQPAWAHDRRIAMVHVASVGASLLGVWWFWPTTPGFWQQSVWWETETAREGMGMMIVLVVLLVSAAGLATAQRRQR